MMVAMRRGLEEEEEEEAMLEMEMEMGMGMWVGLSWGIEGCYVFLREGERLRAVDFLWRRMPWRIIYGRKKEDRRLKVFLFGGLLYLCLMRKRIRGKICRCRVLQTGLLRARTHGGPRD